MTRAELHGFKEAGKSATRAEGLGQRALLEYDGFAAFQVRGDDSDGDGQIFQMARTEAKVEKCGKPLVAAKGKTGTMPAGEVAGTDLAARSDHRTNRRTPSIGCTEYRADAAAGNTGDGNLLFFEDAQHTEMGKTARETSTEREAYAWAKRRRFRETETRMDVRTHERKVLECSRVDAMGRASRSCGTKGLEEMGVAIASRRAFEAS
jgi:hypothetical protein